VYVERPELQALQSGLVTFLSHKNPVGAFWAVEGERGVGKSNFLQHLELELATRIQTGDLPGTAYRYVGSQAVAPRFLVQELLAALEQERIAALLETKPAVPSGVVNTDLGRFFAAVRAGPTSEASEHAEFMMRWLGGHQTYAEERKRYGIWTRERLYPAIAFPYLRTTTQLLVDAGLIERIVLLLDEFEDVDTLDRATQTEYVQALKGLVNAFNWNRLFIVLAGQQGIFVRIGEMYTSLASRWQTATLQPLTTSASAVNLALK
jgi:hypothetical protein